MDHGTGLTVFVVAVFFSATLIRSALGFGEALVAVPLIAFVLPVEIAAPVAVLVSITVAAVVLAQDWRHVNVRSAMWLVGFTLPGIALLSWWRRDAYHLRDDRLAWLFGVSAGVLGGAYGMNGPPLVVYGSLRRWPPERFRATLQGYFLPASILGMAGYAAAGLWTSPVNNYYLLSLPGVLLAIPIGRAINARFDTHRFVTVVHAGLLASGVGLVIQALRTSTFWGSSR